MTTYTLLQKAKKLSSVEFETFKKTGYVSGTFKQNLSLGPAVIEVFRFTVLQLLVLAFM